MKSASVRVAAVPVAPPENNTLISSPLPPNTCLTMSIGDTAFSDGFALKTTNCDFDTAFSINEGDETLNVTLLYFSTSSPHSTTTSISHVFKVIFGKRPSSTTSPSKGSSNVTKFPVTFFIILNCSFSAPFKTTTSPTANPETLLKRYFPSPKSSSIWLLLPMESENVTIIEFPHAPTLLASISIIPSLPSLQEALATVASGGATRITYALDPPLTKK